MGPERVVLREGGAVPTVPDVQHANCRFLAWGLRRGASPSPPPPYMPCAPQLWTPASPQMETQPLYPRVFDALALSTSNVTP